MTTEAIAPAKVNLALHVTGRRADGYHLLDSLVVFTACGDRLRAAPAENLSLRIEGDAPGARALATECERGGDNLVLRAAALLAGRASPAPPGARIALQKRLPVGGGLGGGSADAAAALRLLSRLWGLPLPDAQELLSLGADLPACLTSRPLRMGGIGERLAPLEMPPLHLVLAHPGVPLSTPQVFAALAQRQNPPLPASPPRWRDGRDLARWLAGMRNDLEGPALGIQPQIGAIRAALAASPGCLLARMSGSGAACFGIFETAARAEAAAAQLSRAHPGWWACATKTLQAPPPVRESSPRQGV